MSRDAAAARSHEWWIQCLDRRDGGTIYMFNTLTGQRRHCFGGGATNRAEGEATAAAALGAGPAGSNSTMASPTVEM